jgi:hypothetical protein
MLIVLNHSVSQRFSMSGDDAMSPSPKDQMDLRSLVLLAFSATAGVLVEYYDFFIFGYAAASAFPKIFFPNLSPTLALVFSFLIFGAGFPARLLGAFVFGHYGDRVGRKNAFLINLLMVGIATCLTGLLPGYATLGVGAPALLVALRIIQGIGLGGEFGGASSLLAEFAAKRKHLDVPCQSRHPWRRHDSERRAVRAVREFRHHRLAHRHVAVGPDRDSGAPCALQACRYAPVRTA